MSVIAIIIFILGLVIGSFMNALVWRIKLKQPIGGSERSVCDFCGKTLTALELIPVISWAVQRGRCRSCGKKLSIIHPIFELVMGFAFLSTFIFWPSELHAIVDQFLFAGWLAILAGLLAIALYDIKWMLIPDRVLFPLYGLQTVRVLVQAIAQNDTGVVLTALGGVAVGGGLFYVLFQLSRGRWIGGGDVKLGFLLGSLLGPYESLLMLFISSLLGLVVTVPFLLTKKLDRKQQFPYGPFLILAAILCVLFGEMLIDFYTINLLQLGDIYSKT